MPGGARGVRLKSKFPHNETHADSFRCVLNVPKRFKVISAYGMSLHHRCRGKLSCVEVSIEMR